MAQQEKQGKELEKTTPSRGLTPFEEMERWFEDFFPRTWMHRWGWPHRGGGPSWGELSRPLESMAPRVNVIDRDDEVVVRAEVSGMKKDDLDVTVTESGVTIKGSTRREEKEEKGDYFRREIAEGAFARTVGLPGTVDSEKAKATFREGILEITIPKMAKTTRKSIKIE